MRDRARMLVLDVDGTVLDSSGQIRPSTREAVARASRQGVLVTLATTRRFGRARPIAERLGLDGPVIVCDGAVVRATSTGSILWHNHLPAETARQIVSLMVACGLQPLVDVNAAVGDHILIGPSSGDPAELGSFLAAVRDLVRRIDHDQLCSADPIRVYAFDTPERLARGRDVLSHLPCRVAYNPLGSFGCGELIVMNSTCSKASAIEWLAGQQGWSMADVVAIGDGYNDVEMLGAVGLGLAMGNAVPEVRSVAEAVIGTNDEDAIADAIERYVLAPINITSAQPVIPTVAAVGTA